MGALLHALNVLGGRVHFSAERYRVLVVDAAHEFDRCGGVERGPQFGVQLVEVLVGHGDAHVVLAALVEKRGGFFVDVLLGLVDVEVKRRSVFGGDGGAADGRLRDERDKEAAENRGAFVLE